MSRAAKKNLTLHMGKHTPLVRKHTSTWENPCTLPHTEDVSQWRGQNTPHLFKDPGPEKKMGLYAWETRILVRRPMST